MILSETLQSKRQELELSLEDIQNRIGLPPKYLAAFESGNYHELPAPVYAESYLKKLAALYRLDEEDTISAFREERISKDPFADVTRLQPQAISSSASYFTTKRIAAAVLGSIFLVAVGYLLWQVLQITAAPKLALDSPTDGEQIDTSFIDVRGHTEAGATVTINNQTIPVNSDGTFDQNLYLNPGENYIIVKAENRFKRQREIKRRIVLSQSPLPQVLGATAADQKPAQ
jgi:cytoskeletal protein RodZ